MDSLRAALKDRAGMAGPPGDAFRTDGEFIVRDRNGFGITFAEPVSQ